jgi:tetratricopeptide (TPR) repeat protein
VYRTARAVPGQGAARGRAADVQRENGMKRKLICGILTALVVVLFLGPPALADAEEDARFAKGLLNPWGFVDYAEEIAERVRQQTSDDNCLQMALEVLRDAAFWRYQKAVDPQEKERWFQKYNEYMDLLSKIAGDIIELQRIGTQITEAEKKTNKAREEKNQEKRNELISEAEGIFKAVISKLDNIVEKARKKVATFPGVGTQEEREMTDKQLEDRWNTWRTRNLAEYLRGDAYLKYGMFQKLSDPAKAEETLKQAVRLLKLFVEGSELDEEEEDERFEIPEYPYWATIGLGRAYLELGKYEDALEYFDYMIDPGYPGGKKKKAFHEKKGWRKLIKHLKKITLDVRRDAYRWTAETYVLQKNWQGVIDIVDEMFEKLPGSISVDAGKRAMISKAAAHLEREEYIRAITGLYEIYRSEMQSSAEKPTGWQIDVAKQLCDIYSKAPSTFRAPAPMMLAVAKGFLWREKWREATFALRDVDAGPSPSAEDLKCEEDALWDLGHAYSFMNEHYESGFAFMEIAKLFPKSPNRVNAIKYARTAFAHNKDKTPADKELYAEVTKLSEGILSGEEGQESVFNEGSGLMEAKKYEEAIKQFAEVREFVENPAGQKVKIKIYGRARFFAGYCARDMLIAAANDNMAFIKIKEYHKHRDLSVRYLQEAVKWFTREAGYLKSQRGTLGESKYNKDVGEVLEYEAKSRCYLAEILTTYKYWYEWKQAQPQIFLELGYAPWGRSLYLTNKAADRKKERSLAMEAYKLLKEFDTRLAGQAKYVSQANRLQLVALLMMERADEAVKKFKEIEKSYKNAPEDNEKNREIKKNWRQVLKDGAVSLGNQFYRWAVLLENMNKKDKADKYYEKAANILIKWLSLMKEMKETLKFSNKLWAGHIVFRAGKVRAAAKIYKEMVNEFKGKNLTEAEEDAFNIVKLRLAKCSFAIGDYMESIKQCRELVDNPPLKWLYVKNGKPVKDPRTGKVVLMNLAPLRQLADAYLAQYWKSKKKDKESLQEALLIFVRMHPRIDENNKVELFWHVVSCLFEIYYEKGLYSTIQGDCRIMARSERVKHLWVSHPEYARKIIGIWHKAVKKLGPKALASDDLLKKELEYMKMITGEEEKKEKKKEKDKK